MRISFVTTIYNEESSIADLLQSLLQQSETPDEIVIVDGGSIDGTVYKVKELIKFLKSERSKVKLILIEKRGNRSVGRNEGIEKATGDIIVLSDAGCILDKDFIKEIVKPFEDKSVDVVAGYYKGQPKTIFQECLIPYVLVMPDRVDPDTFLPATRSMAMRKHVWKELGGFDVRYSHNEDYVFAKRLQKNNKNIKIAQNAIVSWIPRSNLKEAYTMFYRFALGDVEAGIMRPKVILLFARYIIGVLIFLYLLYYPLLSMLLTLLTLLILYGIWAICKNYRYIKKWQAIFYLPVIQYTADLAVMLGSMNGLLKRYGI